MKDLNHRNLLSLLLVAALAVSGCSDDDTSDDGDSDSMGMDASPSDETDADASAMPDPSMSFFVTSVGNGADGGDLGGIDGADSRCQQLATTVGAGDKTWRAYVSTDDVDARDRIGDGPWYNHDGALIAMDIDQLHEEDHVFNGDPNLILDETGVNAPVREHDILTGTLADGTAAEGLNCENWTSSSAELEENPQVGHSDIPGNPMFSPSWNSAHVSANCSEAGLEERGGAGRLYCFAL